jgi:alkanesulfonate monooxygenase SsuD/methylene tetrahydromethanopterin reductase-like flavin-dependent oxidoreductase (luciferase family)
MQRPLLPEGPSLGVQPWLQATDVGAIVGFATRAEELGYEAIWSQDHLLSPHGSPDQPIFEALAIMTAWAMATERIAIGCMVHANTFRNPLVLMKSLITTDHLASGRLILGLGGAWWEAEHDSASLEFGSTAGQRLQWLEESVVALRSWLAGRRHSSGGRHYSFADSRLFPMALGPMPLAIGGKGEQRTLRIVAEHADMWNARGSEEELGAKIRRLDEICTEIGRDPRTIVRTTSVSLVIRDDPKDAELEWESRMASNQNPRPIRLPGLLRPDAVWFGPPDYIAARLQSYIDLGFSHLLVDFPAPYDEETLARLSLEVRPLIKLGRES